jgi:hypothetical protein
MKNYTKIINPNASFNEWRLRTVFGVLIPSLLLGLSSCSKPPEVLSLRQDGRLTTLEWTSIIVERIPMYYKLDLKNWKTEQISKLDAETLKKISTELSGAQMRSDYNPIVEITEESHKSAVAELARLLSISESEAREAIPRRTEWRLAINHTKSTEPKFKEKPEAPEKYFEFASHIKNVSVVHDLGKLYEHLKNMAEYNSKSVTLTKHIDPQFAFAVVDRKQPSNVIAVVLPEDPEWRDLQAFYNSR